MSRNNQGLHTLPHGWKSGRFDEFITLQRGFDLPIQERFEGEVPIVASNGVVGFHNEKKVQGPGVITGRSGTIGRVIFESRDYWPLNTTLFVKDFHENDQLFTYYFLQHFKLDRFSNGTGVPTLNRNDVHIAEIAFPPRKEQEKIAKILSTWDEAMSLLTDKIEKLQKVKATHLSSLILNCKKSTQQVVLNDIAELINGRAYKLSEWENEGTPVIRLQNLTGSGDNYYYSNLNLPEDKYCSKGDILFMWSASFGPYIWQGPKAIYHYHIWKVLPREDKIVKSYLYYLLSAYTELWKKKTVGSTMAHLTKEKMEKVPVQLPDLKYQRRVAEYFSSLDTAIETNSKMLKCISEQKKGLMQQLLSGKKRVKV